MKFRQPTLKQALLTLAGFALMYLSNLVEGEQCEDMTREIIKEELDKIKED